MRLRVRQRLHPFPQVLRVVSIALFVALTAFAAFTARAVPAHALYKCEEKGRIAYRDEPCEGGKALNVQGEGIAATADRLAAQEQAARQKQALTHLEKERRQREALEEREMRKAAKAQASKHKKCRALALNRKWAEQDAAAAAGKSVDKARRNAARKAEKYEMECGK
jgi:flagellar biosynthesis GTPase FlhF